MISRRHILPSFTIMLVAGLGACEDPPGTGPDEDVPPETFVEPQILDTTQGVASLSVGLSRVEIDGQAYCLRSYNGQVPGPTIEIPEQVDGQERLLQLDVVNELEMSCPGEVGGGVEDSKCACDEANGQTCYDFNSTNFHTHGLHVRPDTNEDGTLLSDHVLMHINHDSAMAMTDMGGAPLPSGACEGGPGEPHRCKYEFNIDEGSRMTARDQHEPGTFFYHAHVHGATAMQLANGMAGALLIRGPVDTQVPAIADAKERLMVLQQIPLNLATPLAEGESCDAQDPESYSINDFGTVTDADRTLINGVFEPVIHMDAGEVQRWRLIHGGISDEIQVVVQGPVAPGSCDAANPEGEVLSLAEIAVDGITLNHVRMKDQLRLVPGYRSDVLVQLPDDATTVDQEYCVFDGPGPDLQDPDAEEERSLLARIYVAGERELMALPTDAELEAIAKPPLDCDSDLDPGQRAIFDQQLEDPADPASPECPALNINCETFPDMKFDLELDAEQRWDLQSGSNSHPFHIHVNPFTVCKENGEVLERPYWRDTILLEEGENEETFEYEIRSRYEAFTGAFVTHCHKLQHEDRGMMGLIEISEAPAP